MKKKKRGREREGMVKKIQLLLFFKKASFLISINNHNITLKETKKEIIMQQV